VNLTIPRSTRGISNIVRAVPWRTDSASPSFWPESATASEACPAGMSVYHCWLDETRPSIPV
jgi:hypothetical protein